MQSALSKERRELKQTARAVEMDSIPTGIHKNWIDPMPDCKGPARPRAASAEQSFTRKLNSRAKSINMSRVRDLKWNGTAGLVPGPLHCYIVTVGTAGDAYLASPWGRPGTLTHNAMGLGLPRPEGMAGGFYKFATSRLRARHDNGSSG